EDGIRDLIVTGVQTCALPISLCLRPRVKNVSVAVREHKGEVIFLHKIVPGAASRSYGIEVARLAGLPKSVVARARQILGALEERSEERRVGKECRCRRWA